MPFIPAARSIGSAVPVASRQKLKTSLNAFSFNAPLLDGSMNLDDLLDFCNQLGFEGVDMTAYYFKGYPNVPTDDYVFHLKKKAFRHGIEISGTGVRNDFTIADKEKRKNEVQLVKNWIEVAAKLGAPVLRIFAGTQKNEGIPREQVLDWVLNDIQTCVDYGKQHGVIIGLQNHNDFIMTADHIIQIFEAIKSEWLGLLIDIASYRTDPYGEIERTIKYAVNWQLKEQVYVNGKETDTDLNKLFSIIKKSSYQGYIPIETLGAGDPKQKVESFLKRVKPLMS